MISSFLKRRKRLKDSFKRFFVGRGSRIRTHTSGFGDRCATINTIPLNEIDNKYNNILKNIIQALF